MISPPHPKLAPQIDGLGPPLVPAVAAVVLVLAPLGAIFGYLVYKGIGAVNWNSSRPHADSQTPPGEVGGGMANRQSRVSLHSDDCQRDRRAHRYRRRDSILRNTDVIASAT
jgi:hypothetical protein